MMAIKGRQHGSEAEAPHFCWVYVWFESSGNHRLPLLSCQVLLVAVACRRGQGLSPGAYLPPTLPASFRRKAQASGLY
jgi:hypothetical protein